MMPVIEIIGGAGFIGTRLCHRLAESGSAHHVMDKCIIEVEQRNRKCDVRYLDQLRDSITTGAVIVNLAAEHRDDVQPKKLYDDVNVQGARNVCAVAEEKGVKKI